MIIPEEGFGEIEYLCLREVEFVQTEIENEPCENTRATVSCIAILNPAFSFNLSTPIETVKTQYLMVYI